MRKLNLLRVDNGVKRDLSLRLDVTTRDRQTSAKFGEEYFDGDRKLGYGGYNYDGRWVKVAKRLIENFELKPGAKILDVGCAKGFLVKDLVDLGFDAYGIDVSEYALGSCPDEVVGRLHLGDMRTLPFRSNTFDVVVCINTLHNLNKIGALNAITEFNRIIKDPRSVFIQVDAWRDEKDLSILEKWLLTANLYMTPDQWLDFFEECDFEGSNYWTILNADGTVI